MIFSNPWSAFSFGTKGIQTYSSFVLNQFDPIQTNFIGKNEPKPINIDFFESIIRPTIVHFLQYV
jgi:hypothetical protein